MLHGFLRVHALYSFGNNTSGNCHASELAQEDLSARVSRNTMTLHPRNVNM